MLKEQTSTQKPLIEPLPTFYSFTPPIHLFEFHYIEYSDQNGACLKLKINDLFAGIFLRVLPGEKTVNILFELANDE